MVPDPTTSTTSMAPSDIEGDSGLNPGGFPALYGGRRRKSGRKGHKSRKSRKVRKTKKSRGKRRR